MKNPSKNKTFEEVYLEPMRASMMELFCEYTQRLYVFAI